MVAFASCFEPARAASAAAKPRLGGTLPPAKKRIRRFFPETADRVGESAPQVVDRVGETEAAGYDPRLGYVLPPKENTEEKPDWQKKVLDVLCGSAEGRKAVERLSKVSVHAADSIMANIDIGGSVRSVSAGGFFRAGEGAVYLNVGGKSPEYVSSKIVHEATHVQQFLDLGHEGFRGLSRTDKEVPAYGTQEQFHIEMGWPAVNDHTRRYTGFLGMGGPAVDFDGIRTWQDSINSVGNYLDPTIEGLNMNVGGWECPEN